MSYKEMLERAQKAGSTESLTPKYVEWEKKGEVMVGRLRGIAEVQGKDGKSSYHQYIMDTDIGLVKFSLGSATDKESGLLMEIGKVYGIKYGGKEDLGGGRKVNKFEVVRIPGADAYEDSETSQPIDE